MTAIWISTTVSLVSAIVVLITLIGRRGKHEGENEAAAKEWRSRVDDTLDRFDSYHDQHFKHASADSALHWTSAERSELYRRLDVMSADIKELLKR